MPVDKTLVDKTLVKTAREDKMHWQDAILWVGKTLNMLLCLSLVIII